MVTMFDTLYDLLATDDVDKVRRAVLEAYNVRNGGMLPTDDCDRVTVPCSMLAGRSFRRPGVDAHRVRLRYIQQQQQQRPLSSSVEPIGLGGVISHFYSPQPDTNLRCEFPGPGLVNRENVSVVAAAQSYSSFLPTRT